MTTTTTITNFREERNEALEAMIQARKDRWDTIEKERHEIRGEIGKLMAERDFMEAIGSFALTEEVKPILDKINHLSVRYNDHVESYKLLADRLDNEMVILENLKTK